MFICLKDGESLHWRVFFQLCDFFWGRGGGGGAEWARKRRAKDLNVVLQTFTGSATCHF